MLIIDGKKIIPAPLVTLSKTYNKTGDDRRLSSNFNISLTGTILPGRGSPNSSGTFHTTSGYPADESLTDTDTKFNSILRKQDALRELFITPGVLLEYGANDGSPAVLARVKLESINFEPGTWVDSCGYRIDLKAEDVNKQSTSAEDDFDDFDDKYLTQASESISVVQNTDGTGTYQVSHNISAVGITSYDNLGTPANSQAAWKNAKDWVLAQINNDLVTYLIDTTTQTKYNKVVQENIDAIAGSYSVSITYTIQESNNNYSHLYTISRNTTRSLTDEQNVEQLLSESITVNGTVNGFDADNDPAVKLANALDAYNNVILPAIPAIIGLTSDHLYNTQTVNQDASNGTVSYSLVYNNNPNGESYTHNYSVSSNINGGGPSSATINGTIQGLLVEGNVAGVMNTVIAAWSTIKNSLRGYVIDMIDYDVVAEPSALQVAFDKQNLRITYSASYNYTDASNGSGAGYLDQYEVSINDNNTTMSGSYRNSTTATINGTITGLSDVGSSDEKYANALARWNNIKTTLNTRISDIIGVTVSDRVLSKTFAHNKVNGSISYSYSFAVRSDISNASIINETINLEFSDPRDIFAVQIIPGLATGPILQDLGTVSEASTTLSASFTLANGAVTGVADTRFAELEALYQPTSPRFLANKTRSYDPNTGVYTVVKSWTHKG